VALVGESRFERDLRNRKRAAGEETPGPFDAAPNHVFVHRQTGRFAKGHLEMRASEPGDRGNFGKGEVIAEIFFHIRDDLAEAETGQAPIARLARCGDGAMAIQEAGSQRHSKTFDIERAAAGTGIYIGHESPADIFDLPVTRLKAIYDFDVAGVEPRVFGRRGYELIRNTDDESGVPGLEFPAAGHVGRDDIDIAVDGYALVPAVAAAARHVDGSSDMNHDDGITGTGRFYQSGGIGLHESGESGRLNRRRHRYPGWKIERVLIIRDPSGYPVAVKKPGVVRKYLPRSADISNVNVLSQTVAAGVWTLPPLILHPFAPENGPDKLLEGSKAQLMLQGLIPRGDVDLEDLRRIVLAGRYQEIRMLYFLGKDILRWAEQCVDFVKRQPLLQDMGIRDQSFSSLLVESPPEALTEKMAAWGISDRRSIFLRAIGLNVLFTEPPKMELLSTLFLQSYQRFSDYFFVCYQNLSPFAPLDASKFLFEIYASEDYARKLAEGWV
jgi:hypothetical protein